MKALFQHLICLAQPYISRIFLNLTGNVRYDRGVRRKTRIKRRPEQVLGAQGGAGHDQGALR